MMSYNTLLGDGWTILRNGFHGAVHLREHRRFKIIIFYRECPARPDTELLHFKFKQVYQLSDVVRVWAIKAVSKKLDFLP